MSLDLEIYRSDRPWERLRVPTPIGVGKVRRAGTREFIVGVPSFVRDSRARRRDWREIIREYVDALKASKYSNEKEIRRAIGAMWREAEANGAILLIDGY